MIRNIYFIMEERDWKGRGTILGFQDKLLEEYIKIFVHALCEH
jgi:hypothetical protein